MVPRIIFMGTPEFAVAVLDKLVQENYQVVAVVTAPDKPAGRGRRLHQSAVKKYASFRKIPVLQPVNLKNQDFIDQLSSFNADLQIVVAFRMLPKSVWSLPNLGTFNLHGSLLPEYRGAAPIHWAIINGETKTGVTTFFIDDKIDTGEIIFREEIGILPNETVGELHDKLMHLGADLVCKTVDAITSNNISTLKQPHGDLKLAPKLNSDNTKIDWSQNIEIVYNKIRGLNPFPSAWTEIKNGDELISAKIYGIEKIEENHNYSFGDIVTNKEVLKIAAKGGFINVKEIKLAGKKKMDVKSLLNGYKFQKNAKAL